MLRDKQRDNSPEAPPPDCLYELALMRSVLFPSPDCKGAVCHSTFRKFDFEEAARRSSAWTSFSTNDCNVDEIHRN